MFEQKKKSVNNHPFIVTFYTLLKIWDMNKTSPEYWEIKHVYEF